MDLPRPTKEFWYAAAGLVVLVLIIFFLIVPAFKGYRVYKAMRASGVEDTYLTDMQSLSTSKAQAQADVQAAQAQAQSAQTEAAQAADRIAASQKQLASCDDARAQCAAELEKARKLKDDTMKSLSEDVAAAQTALATCEKDLEAAQDAESAVVADAARRLCCVQRVENPKIDSYNVVDGKIVCAEGAKGRVTC